ncbi:MAG: hypothetical protein KDD06_03540 [Phaeodactylibacter sp.]|nr:hypothetical protein [Phaeodactylibacter sp.]MCB9264289.1 hypothetical protein [Lewinellaceae bacterium]
MKYYCFLLMMLSSFTAQAQAPACDTFTSAYLQPFTHHFSIENGRLNGPGAGRLKEAIAHSQFTVLGEYHYSRQLSHLTKALLPWLQRCAYRHFAVEVGPYSARILQRLSAEPEKTAARLRELNTYYTSRYDTPIPFFDGVEDAQFLAAATNLGFQLWGLDQEFVYSPPMLSAELLHLAEGRPDHAEIEAAKVAFDSLFSHLQQKDDEGIKGYRMFKELTEHPITSLLFSYFGPEDTEAQGIITALRKTWDIYDRNDYRGGYSHAHRISYIRQNFLANYEKFREKKPKVFVKIGALHAARGYEFGVYDVGNLVYELARTNDSRSCHIYTLSRYYYEDGALSDAVKERPGGPAAAFRMMGKKDEWALIELKPLKERLDSGSLCLREGPELNKVKFLAENFDFVLITPADAEQEPNYEVSK